MAIIKRLSLFIILLVLGVFLGQYLFSPMYYWYPENLESGWFGSKESWSLLFGAILAFYFFLPLLITAIFNKQKYYLLIVNIILLLPVLWLFVSSFSFVATLVLLTVVGWLIGEGISRLIKSKK